MTIKEYLDKKIIVQKYLLNYIEEDDISSQESFGLFILNFDPIETPEDRSEFKSALYLLVDISINHKRSPTFFTKLEKILFQFKDKIKQSFSNSEIFRIFKKSKRLLLFLIENEFIEINQQIIDKLKSLKYQVAYYSDYFEPEICKFEGISFYLDDQEFKDFQKKRKNGENDNYICTLIQNDSVEEFIQKYNEGRFSLTTEISPSIFETNKFLLNRKVTLMEYSVFYGSIQIFQYLFKNNIELTSSLWLFAIHGKNGQIIHFLEENNIFPKGYSFEKCLVESIKCYHNDIFNYIKEKDDTENSLEFVCYLASKSIKYNNYETFPDDIRNASVFYDLCQYDYYPLARIFLKEVNIDINTVIVFPLIFNKIPSLMFFK